MGIFDEITFQQLVPVHTTNDVALPCGQMIANICYLADVLLAKSLVHIMVIFFFFVVVLVCFWGRRSFDIGQLSTNRRFFSTPRSQGMTQNRRNRPLQKKKKKRKENRGRSVPVRQHEWSTPATSTIAFDIGRDLLYNCKSWPWLKSTLTLSDSLLPLRPVVQHHFSKKSLPNIYHLFMQLQPSWAPGINYWSRLLSTQ